MKICPLPAGCSNIGHRLDGSDWIREKWNPRYSQALPNQDQGIPCPGGKKWLMRLKIQGKYSYGRAVDSNRNWTAPYQDIVVVFNTKVQDTALSPGGTATGHTIKINTVVQTTNYQSGSGTATWTLRIPVLCDKDDAITYSYDSGTGNTTAVDNAQEIASLTDIQVNNLLTRRIRFTLKKSDNNPAASETVKMAVHLYNSGTVQGLGDDATIYPDGRWMRRIMQATPTTDSNGLIDVEFVNQSLINAVCGDTIYIVIYRPNATPTESFAWVDTVK